VAVDTPPHGDACRDGVEILIEAAHAAGYRQFHQRALFHNVNRLDIRDLPVAQDRLHLHVRSTPCRPACSWSTLLISAASACASIASSPCPRKPGHRPAIRSLPVCSASSLTAPGSFA